VQLPSPSRPSSKRFGSRIRSSRDSPWNCEDPIRSELFSVERLEEHGVSLAKAQSVARSVPRRPSLTHRLRDNESVLLGAYRYIAAAVADGDVVSPAAEWLLDNFHLVEEQIREIRQDLPDGYYRQLPKLADGPLLGYPRVLGVAWAFVSHTDSRFDPDALCRFLHAYQSVEPLTIGELWAVAITLRIVLVENLRRSAQRSVAAREARRAADVVTDRLLESNSELQPVAPPVGVTDSGALRTEFAAQLVQRLRDQDPRVTPALKWLEERLAKQGTTSSDIVHEEHQRQGAANVTVRNIITSMRLVSDVDWAEIFENVSCVDRRLREVGEFAAVDFATRNMYRSAIEDLARRSPLTELEVAERSIQAGHPAGGAVPGGDVADAVEAMRRADPGYRLIGPGRAAFERLIGYRPSWRNCRTKFHDPRAVMFYCAALATTAVVVLAAPVAALRTTGLGVVALAVIACLGVIPASDAAVALVNWVVTRRVAATRLPALALRHGIPADLRTMVVVPILLTSREAVLAQVERLEIHFLAAPPGALSFALLSDWTDAAQARADGDEEILEVAAEAIAVLNRRHGPADTGARFFLLHRERRWSPTQRAWIGWERKRGKIHELNRLLRGATDTTYATVRGCPPGVPSGTRFVITLDADTRVPPEAIRRLIGKMAHPLNRPLYDRSVGRVVEGYAVLQPRVTAALPIGAAGSVFQRIFSSTPGIDPYTAAVSDVYQDLFAEGSYAGKGIYDVDAFEAALAGRVPDGAVLSHDLFEGTFARSALVSDIEVVEDVPARYDQATRRLHRWVRGDWQLLPWILGRRDCDPSRGGSGMSLTLLNRWKMLDNLRRSVSAPACVAALLVGWELPLRGALVWTAFVVVTIGLPALLPVLAAVLPHRAGITFRSHIRAFLLDAWLAACQMFLLVAFVAHHAAFLADALVRSLFRMSISQANLLEWLSAAQAKAAERLSVTGMYRHMAGGVAIGAAAAVAALVTRSAASPIEGAFAVLWLLAPAIALFVSRPPRLADDSRTSGADVRELRLVARRTWRYFETFIVSEEHNLPPDNFQEDPRPTVAHRTSPTNIGLYLLSTTCARTYGWLGTDEMALRLEATLTTIDGLELFRGHLYNWYDTRDLRPLDPRYVSAVDSGNLAGHLIAVANACERLALEPPTAEGFIAGIGDALALAFDALPRGAAIGQMAVPAGTTFKDALRNLSVALSEGECAADDPGVRLRAAVDGAAALRSAIAGLEPEASMPLFADSIYWARAAERLIAEAIEELSRPAGVGDEIDRRLRAIAAAARRLANGMDFRFLFDERRRLLSIGYRVADGVLDPSCYDLLASEARLASFVAIAKGDVPARHWFRLGRAVAPVGSGAALVSWSGSMFEYLMPSLVMRAPTGSLLDHTSRLVVRRQISYGHARHVPWGVSESGYNARDIDQTYQYATFGVPGLGLKRGLKDNLVVAPYATALASMVQPSASLENFERLRAAGALGRHGFYEALDYTPTRVPTGQSFAVIHSFMAHHQGMTIVAVANAIFDGVARSWLHAEPSIQAVELLLQERTPRDVSVQHPRAEEVADAVRETGATVPMVRIVRTPHDQAPEVQLLSNGRYAVMVSAVGAGYSRWGDIAITRWREDATREDSGTFIYLRDVVSNERWSATYQPTGVEAETYAAVFSEDRIEFSRADGSLATQLEIIVSPEDDAEVRRLSIANSGFRTREIEVTSCLELVLAPPAGDAEHAAFSKLFVETEVIPETGAILATRRRRAPDEPEVWVAHYTVAEGDVVAGLEAETSRADFIGRGRELRDAIATLDGKALSGTAGCVLDAVAALRVRVRIPPRATARIAFWTVAAASRAAALSLVDKHREPNAFARANTLSWTQAQVQLRHLGIDASEAMTFQRLAGLILYSGAGMRPSSEAIQRGAAGPAALWSQGISGDIPIVLLRIDDVEDLSVVRQLLRAHEYWRQKRLAVDLVILNERGSSYVQDLQVALDTAVRTSESRARHDRDPAFGSVFVIRADLISGERRAALSAAARVVVYPPRGSLVDQLEQIAKLRPAALRRVSGQKRTGSLPSAAVASAAPAALEFFNGIGGFDGSAKEYVTRLAGGATTPVPWINVIANRHFGFQVSAEGGCYSWALSSRENKLTPWSNDPVTDRPGEVVYLRDEATGDIWCPTARPIRDDSASYTVRHGYGYSRFEHASRGIALDLVQFVALEDPVKISRLRLTNTSSRTRSLSVVAYLEWVLGTRRGTAGTCVSTSIDPDTGAFLATNPWHVAFGPRIAFVDLVGRQTEWTGDRREFLGRFGTLSEPAALLAAQKLSQRVGAGLDPCAALLERIELAPGATADVVILLGEASSVAEARSLITRHRSLVPEDTLREVRSHWDSVLGAVQVRTPDRSLDLMMNGWLLYQTLACRLWARSAFYQSSGAYGFRDQLQDCLALTAAQPALAREHLLRAAGRQFKQGDVQHWWLPHSGEGVRTRISDDRVWLAYAVSEYVAATGDRAVLGEPVPFLEGQALGPAEHDAYFRPTQSDETASVYEHCARALDQSLAAGVHGLPLMGTGDWNDGMNRVGELGLGESVWLGWFLHAALIAFAPLADGNADVTRARRWREHAAALRTALDQSAWDGAWYKRAFFDDGTPLGSAANSECRIDAIAQSWSVISNAGEPARARRAMAAAQQQLIEPAASLALLFTPPFDKFLPDPGYIKGYPPGVRENGGQYTHAAVWSVIALAMLGEGDSAMELMRMLNPVNRSATPTDAHRYKVEPYVMAADIYSVAPHIGRGGWTWYTGSSGWMYRAGLEWLLGLRRRGSVLEFAPCIPTHWPGLDIAYRYGSSNYEIRIDNPEAVSRGVVRLELDGTVCAHVDAGIPLTDDGKSHRIRVTLGIDAGRGAEPERAVAGTDLTLMPPAA
jgi:cyclic beta-1,2-glucan synthetase